MEVKKNSFLEFITPARLRKVYVCVYTNIYVYVCRPVQTHAFLLMSLDKVINGGETNSPLADVTLGVHSPPLCPVSGIRLCALLLSLLPATLHTSPQVSISVPGSWGQTVSAP